MAFAKQGVHITGLGSPIFEEALSGLNLIAEIFQNETTGPIADIQPCDYLGYTALSFSNRYFTRQSDAPYRQLRPLSEEMDPLNILNRGARVSKYPLVTCAENEVKYYVRKLEKDKRGKQ